MQLIVTYYNFMTALDKQVNKIVGVKEKSKIYSGVDGGRSITYDFATIKALNIAKKALQTKIPINANLKIKVVK